MTTTEPATHAIDDELLIRKLEEIVGSDHVETEEGRRLFFATDMYNRGEAVTAVVAVGTSQELSAVIKLCEGSGRPVIPRGGGFSYAKGYVSIEVGAVSIDLRRMNSIVEINTEDRYVVVEAGCTWVKLYDALKEKGFRTPFFGPMSGFRATVGGGLSQGAFFLGSTQYGTGADSVLGLEVVLGDGSIVVTGSAGATNTNAPFFRNYGPDLTGLFLHDQGALAFKTKIAFKLIPFPEHSRFASFAFPADKEAAALAALSDIARAGLAAECYVWDPAYAHRVRSMNSAFDDIKYFTGVLKSGKSIVSGLVAGLKMAKAGKNFLTANNYLLHVNIDDVTDAGAEARLEEVFKLALSHGGEAIEPTIPRALRGRPFNDFAAVLLADQRNRILPTQGVFPHSSLIKVGESIRTFLRNNEMRMSEHGISSGVLYFAIGSSAVYCEPLLYWRDEELALHDRREERSDVKALAKLSERPAAGRAVGDMRVELMETFTSLGATHLSVGKTYPYRATRQVGTYALLQSVKDAVDPAGIINPGALGLNTPA